MNSDIVGKSPSPGITVNFKVSTAIEPSLASTCRIRFANLEVTMNVNEKLSQVEAVVSSENKV